VNTDPYERRLDLSLDTPETTPEPVESEPNLLARHADPSLQPTRDVADQQSASSVAWVRPSEMPTVVGSKFIRRGIDLQAELSRRAQHAPRNAARVTRRAIARPKPSTPPIDRGLEL
jgi:hypothetical protein